MVIIQGRNRKNIGLQLRKDLVEYWPLNEASGTRRGAVNGIDLTDNNTVTGNPGTCGSLASQFTSANSEYLSSSDSIMSPGDTDCSFSGWFYPTEINNDGKDIFGRNAASEYFLELYGTGSPYNFRWRYGSGDLDNQEAGLLLNDWNFFVCWHDSVNNIVGYTLNGTTRTLSYSSGGGTPGGAFEIGRAVAVRYFSGRLQRFGFWKRVLTNEEKTFLYNLGCGKDWPFYAD